MVNLELIHAIKPDFVEGLYLLGINQYTARCFVMIHNNCANRLLVKR